MSERTYVLRAPIASKELGKDICFARMTGIGPMTSADPDEWARFESQAAALRSPARLHMLSVFDVIEVDDEGSEDA